MNGKSKILRHFIPFCLMVVGGFVGLAQFRKINYQYKRNDPVVYKEQLRNLGVDEGDYQMLTTDSLKQEYEKVMNKLDIEHWDNIRGPRPWENSKELQEQLRKKNKKVNE